MKKSKTNTADIKMYVTFNSLLEDSKNLVPSYFKIQAFLGKAMHLLFNISHVLLRVLKCNVINKQSTTNINMS